MATSFLDYMSSVENLGIANCHFNLNYFQTNSYRLLQNLNNLKRIDLSLNSLRYLSKDTFAHNPELIEIYLATNRFTEVPFDLTHTPNLKLLDLSENTITTLDEKVTNQLDKLAARFKEFSLRLAGNVFSCGCGNFRFVKWLLTTHVTIDLSSNLTCVDESGLFVRLDTDLNLETFWRQCWGKESLFVSVVIFCLIIISFVVSFVFMRFKLYIMSKIALLLGTVTLQRITDFPINVFISSYEGDRFAVDELQDFLKNRLRLSTVKTAREFTPGHPTFEGYGMMSESWRIILVISEDFMDDACFQLICNMALCTVSPANPGRVILLVEERLLSRLPVDLVGAVAEENILPVSRWELNYELQENLKTRIIVY
ncbi:toll-like receptor 8 [Physella acuta]|uniref:toll-like receptor 8 n=1 Tax=Physella acuta TaxID=109671 RepID=UPI0027DC1B81|nr:toll-like receptor 8 [Physella acuta]